MKLSRIVLVLAVALTLCVSASAETHLPIPFSAKFDVDFGAFNGSLDLKLNQAETAGVYEYVSNTRARGLARMFYKGEANGSSQFRIVDNQIQPLLYHHVDNKGRTQERILFDWKNNVADGEYEGAASEIDIEPGILDVLTVDLAVSRQLNQSQMPGTATYINRNEIKQYEYAFVDERTVETKFGVLECAMYRRQRVGSRRSYHICYAPDLSNLPIMIEQYRYDKKKDVNELKARMTLRSLDCETCAAN